MVPPLSRAMNDLPTKVLLVEDDPAEAQLIQYALADTGGSSFRVEWVTRFSAALERLGRDAVDVILLDLSCRTARASRRSNRYSRWRRMPWSWF